MKQIIKLLIICIHIFCTFMQNAVEQPPKFVGRWIGAYTINAFIVGWVLVVGFGFGGWASMTNFVHQIDTFGLFTKCYQCPVPPPPPLPLPANATTTATPPFPSTVHNFTASPSPSPSYFGHRHHRHHHSR